MHDSINVLGTNLQPCSIDPVTGWFRDGCCNTDETDLGSHTVCCILTTEFLEFARSLGNDLITPVPQMGFPGLRAGDRWCICAQTWHAAVEAGLACPIILEATHEEALSACDLDSLEKYAFSNE